MIQWCLSQPLKQIHPTIGKFSQLFMVFKRTTEIRNKKTPIISQLPSSTKLQLFVFVSVFRTKPGRVKPAPPFVHWKKKGRPPNCNNGKLGAVRTSNGWTAKTPSSEAGSKRRESTPVPPTHFFRGFKLNWLLNFGGVFFFFDLVIWYRRCWYGVDLI